MGWELAVAAIGAGLSYMSAQEQAKAAREAAQQQADAQREVAKQTQQFQEEQARQTQAQQQQLKEQQMAADKARADATAAAEAAAAQNDTTPTEVTLGDQTPEEDANAKRAKRALFFSAPQSGSAGLSI